MPVVNINDVLLWIDLAERLVQLGVRSWAVIRAAMEDAGVDEATIQAMRPKWIALRDDVRRAAGLDPTG